MSYREIKIKCCYNCKNLNGSGDFLFCSFVERVSPIGLCERFVADNYIKERIKIGGTVYYVLGESETEYLIIQTMPYANGLNRQLLTWTSKKNEGIEEEADGKK